jgi:predicted RecA/RadA family phage recombinase
MAWEVPGFSRSWIAGGSAGVAGSDLSIGNTVNSIVVDSYRYMFVKFSGGLLVPISAGGDFGVGVLQNKPAPGDAANVMISGVTRVRSNDATITVGSAVYMDAFGMVKATATSANHPVGIAEEVAAASSGFVVAVCLKPFGNVWA